MIIAGTLLILIMVLAIVFGRDNGNAVPFLYTGLLGFVFVVASLIETAT